MRDPSANEDEDHGAQVIRPTTLSAALLLVLAVPLTSAGEQTPAPELRPVEYYRDVRGAIVYRTYCVLCHGPKADGAGRAAQNYTPRPANLTVSQASDEYKEAIIRKGGAALGRSQFMPPWEQELTPEQITDVVFYLKVINVNHLLAR